VKILHEKIKKFKAQLIARNFTQKYNINYIEIFALIMQINILRIFFAIVIKFNFKYSHFNIKNAFIKFYFKKKI